MRISAELLQRLLIFQRNEITEYHIYQRLARAQRSLGNREVLEKIAQDELSHYELWKAHTNQEVQPSWFWMWYYYLVSRLFGFTFGIKLMERG